MTLTKTDMAQVIIQALFNTDELPSPANCNVVRMAKNYKKDVLHDHYEKAVKTLNAKVKKADAQ